MTTPVNRVFEFGPFRLDTAERVLLRDGQAVPLTLKTFDVLLFLVENSGHIVAKDELMNRVWAGSIVEEGNLKVTVSMLRKALEDNNGGARYIETVPRRGYRFVAEVSESANESAQLLVHEKTSATVTIQETTEIEGFRESVPANRRALKIGALIAFAVVSAGIAFVVLRRSQNYPTRIPFQEVALRRLTNNRTVRDAALSRDGKLFAYSYTADKEGERGLWVGHVEGGEPILLRPPAAGLYSSLNFAPDNSSLYFIATNPDYPRGALFRIPVFGGAPEKLREGIRPNISLAPDLKRFAYVRSDEEQNESSLIVASLGATNEQKISGRPQARPFVASSLTWSPDGTEIAVGALSNEASQANHEVFLVTAADGKMTQLTKRNFSTIRNLSWLRDGSGLLMVAIAYPELDAQLWYVSYPGGEVRHINPDSYNYSFSLNLSADDGSLLAIQTATLANIWIAPAADLGQAKRVTFGSIGRRDGLHGLDWTPSGRLVFTAAENQGEMLWEMAADGTDQKQLTSAGHVDNDLSVTADGRFIVFQSNRSGNEEVWRANADGGGLLQLTNGGGNEQPSVSSDGRWVVYISTRDKLSALWRIPLAGGDSVRLSDRPAAWPRVSPDGKLIACRYEVPTGSPKTKLAVIPIEGGPPILLFDVPSTVNFRYGVRWTPDGQSLTYRDWVNGIWRQPISGGEPQRLEGLPEEKLFAYGWSRDGKQFAFTRGTEIRDVVLIRNLR